MKRNILTLMLAAFTLSVSANSMDTLQVDKSELVANRYFVTSGEYQLRKTSVGELFVPTPESGSGRISGGIVDEPWIGLTQKNEQLCVVNFKGVVFC
ncbi:hypothetical protein [Thaumasiovibrio sp. DFM-14]|uniref:hypothetical protein n=1 Tax=Thaumasiovibrio sp. DFM-14 TaxID=3384792 RepID=UPI0039A3190A